MRLDELELESWGERIGIKIKTPAVIALQGRLGAGKSRMGTPLRLPVYRCADCRRWSKRLIGLTVGPGSGCAFTRVESDPLQPRWRISAKML